MGKKENPLLWYYQEHINFAELIDGWLFHGKGRVQAEQVIEQDRRLLIRRGKKVYQDRFRDLYKSVEGVGMHLLIGIEHQFHIHYAMPVRGMEYDSSSYVLQVEKIHRKHEEADDLKADERLCGFAKTDRLLPVITLILYCGSKPWDAAMSLHELLNMEHVPEELHPYIADYPLHILDICHTPDARLQEFPPDIRTMFFFLIYKEEPEKLIQCPPKDKLIRSSTCNIIADCIGERGLKRYVKKEEGEKIDMCKAIDMLIMDGEKRGIAIGEKRGEKRGIAIGEKNKKAIERRAEKAEARVRELEQIIKELQEAKIK